MEQLGNKHCVEMYTFIPKESSSHYLNEDYVYPIFSQRESNLYAKRKISLTLLESGTCIIRCPTVMHPINRRKQDNIESYYEN